MTFADMNLAVFEGRELPHVLWQPRLEFWYLVNRERGTLPEHLKDASLYDVYDYCHASVRYFCNPLRVRHEGKVEYEEVQLDEARTRRIWRTPVGEVSDVIHRDQWGLSAYHDEYRIKRPEDFRVVEYMLECEVWWWDEEAYQQALKDVAGRGAPQFFFRRSPLQNLFIQEMGFEAAIYCLHDNPEIIRRYIEVQTRADDRMYEVLCRCPVKILNFGENIDAHMSPPPIWLEYHVPYYRQRLEQLHEAGKYVHIHIDGAMKPLVEHIQAAPFDGVEAATPEPQGDVTVEEIKRALGDMVLLDGIPAVYFLPTYPEEELVECARRIVELFHPRLVLGISDEIPPDGDIERVRLIGELCRNWP